MKTTEKTTEGTPQAISIDEAKENIRRCMHAVAEALKAMMAASLGTGNVDACRQLETNFFDYFHQQASVLEAALLAQDVDADVVDGIVDAARGEVPALLVQARAALQRDRDAGMVH